MNTISRRTLLVSSFSTAYILMLSRSALSQISPGDESDLPPLPQELESLSSEDSMNQEFLNDSTPLGTAPPTQDQINVSKEIIDSCPTNTTPYAVAKHLLAVAKGNIKDEWRPYTRAWPISAPANPLILAFFRETKTRPEGDTTAWCAAFMNWCISRSLINANSVQNFSGPTESASSGSFRSWGKEEILVDATSSELQGSFEPKPGDIVVYKLVVNGVTSPYRGHVGFFVDRNQDRIKVLGGNQFEGKPTVHAINEKWLPITGPKLRLHSIRRDPVLHRL